MKILIPTEPDDTHAIAVKLCLEKAGHKVDLLFTADQPSIQRNSVSLPSKDYQWLSRDHHANKLPLLINDDYEVIWWRRARKPFISKDEVHPRDYHFVVKENELFFDSLNYNLARKAWWINPKDAALRSHAKLFQLQTAVQSGLQLPLTLCSNDPEEIRSFVKEHEEAGVIYKSFSPGVWFEDRKMKMAYTTKLQSQHLPDDRTLQLTPGIYQKEIKKAFELRVVCFGHYIVAAQLDSQAHPEGQMDWRTIPHGKMQVKPYQLPLIMELKIRDFMQRMGLVFGSLDFIVTPNNEFIFLEINEQGQFLWLEAYQPELKILDIFIQFILNKSIQFEWNQQQCKHQLQSYDEETHAMMQKNLQHHVSVNNEIHQRNLA